jgi:hypothetical protein
VVDKKYIVREPQQSRLGGWICQVFEGEELLYETFQISKQMAFQAAVMWLHDKTDGKLVRIDNMAPPQSTETESPSA